MKKYRIIQKAKKVVCSKALILLDLSISRQVDKYLK
nr:MAG TPA: hypothetical protein [Bacteriophage sp.]